MMLQVRFHGRGGQGVVTSAELLAAAAFVEGRHAQAFPMFGSERTGAPVEAYCRIDDQPIHTHEPVDEPDVLVIGDPTLLHQVAVFRGARTGATVLINTARAVDTLGLEDVAGRLKLVTVPATELARIHLGRPLPGTALLGRLCAVPQAPGIAALAIAVTERFTGAAATGNVEAARAAFEQASALPC